MHVVVAAPALTGSFFLCACLSFPFLDGNTDSDVDADRMRMLMRLARPVHVFSMLPTLPPRWPWNVLSACSPPSFHQPVNSILSSCAGPTHT
eukprot:94256-Chlamydomonas_euryale.AAC.1